MGFCHCIDGCLLLRAFLIKEKQGFWRSLLSAWVKKRGMPQVSSNNARLLDTCGMISYACKAYAKRMYFVRDLLSTCAEGMLCSSRDIESDIVNVW